MRNKDKTQTILAMQVFSVQWCMLVGKGVVGYSMQGSENNIRVCALHYALETVEPR